MPICEAFCNSKQVAICKKKETVCSMCPQLAWRHPMTFLWSAASLDSRTACIMGKLRGLWTPAHFQMSQPARLWPRMMLWLVFSPFLQCDHQNIYYRSPEIGFWFSQPAVKPSRCLDGKMCLQLWNICPWQKCQQLTGVWTTIFLKTYSAVCACWSKTYCTSKKR